MKKIIIKKNLFILLLLSLFLLLSECNDKRVVYRAISKNNRNKSNKDIKDVKDIKDNYIQNSIKIAQERQKAEEEYISNWLKTNNEEDNYYRTSIGTWMKFINPSKRNILTNEQELTYSYQIESFDKDTIYRFDEIGKKKYRLNKTKEIRSIEEALKIMNEGDQVQILSPSFSAYSIYGDEKKIKGNLPIIIKLKVLKINQLLSN